MADLDALEDSFVQAVSQRRMELILLPTEKCNFRCTYCYESFEVGRMPSWVIQAVKALVDRRASELDVLSIMWFGGEPLIANDIVLELSEHFAALARTYDGLQYLASMTTNGSRLDLHTAERLVAVGVRSFQVSLDGPKEHHDRTRLRADGAGSFDVIWNNLRQLAQSSLDIDIMLRLHVTPANRPALPEFVRRVRTELLGDTRFSLLFMPVAHLGGPNDDAFEVLRNDEIRATLMDLTAIADGRATSATTERGASSLGAMDVCYAAKPNSFVVRANGSLAKCTVGFDEPGNSIGRIRRDGTVTIRDAALAPWLQGWKTGQAKDLSCPRDAFFVSTSAPTGQPLPMAG